jgi:fibronectin type 3 domain-containing protein
MNPRYLTAIICLHRTAAAASTPTRRALPQTEKQGCDELHAPNANRVRLLRNKFLLLILLSTSLFLPSKRMCASSSVRLTWTASTSDVIGYNVYRGTESGGPYTQLNSSLVTATTYGDDAVQPGYTYYYVATSVNSANVESLYSNQAQATVPLSGVLTASPTTVNFGNIVVGASSIQTITLTNSGTINVTVSQITVTGAGFTASGLSLPVTLAGGQSTTLDAEFAPTSTGSVTGSISLVSNASNSPTTVSLSGTGIASPSSSVTLTWNASTSAVAGYNAYRGNVSGGPYTRLNSSLVTGLTYTDYSVQAGQTYFYVATAVNANGVESVYSNQVQATVSSSQLSATPSGLSFGNVVVGSSSVQTDTLLNTGTGSLTVIQATVTGAGFSVSGLSLPLMLGAGQNSTFDVTFAPTTTGSVSGNISIVSNATNSPATVVLSGSGVNSHSVALSWTGSASENVSGYDVYRGTQSGGPYTQLNSSLVLSTTYTDTTVQAGQTYYYVITAVGSNQEQSAYSNQAEAIVPYP